MKKISVNNLDIFGIKRMSREDLKMTKGGEIQCGDNEHWNALLQGCVCDPGYSFNYVFGKCVEQGTPTTGELPPKIATCIGKQRYDDCSWEFQGRTFSGRCDYRFASPLYCVDTMFT
ncbi:hypothetical protein [Sphingobacterium faecale]|uniref:Uncharacterized protein n=1 Tax=Sphingobacterium faecale TaxID=2803775 RepID=A0ABS1R4F6_9SPHI|nr:hypothetical protein [Sphingobacterium faecale]MBL1409592.1 hypothetical protein [Sphingobacterium faecale]